MIPAGELEAERDEAASEALDRFLAGSRSIAENVLPSKSLDNVAMLDTGCSPIGVCYRGSLLGGFAKTHRKVSEKRRSRDAGYFVTMLRDDEVTLAIFACFQPTTIGRARCFRGWLKRELSRNSRSRAR